MVHMSRGITFMEVAGEAKQPILFPYTDFNENTLYISWCFIFGKQAG